MAFLSAPTPLVELRIARYPASEGTLVVRIAKRPVSLANAFFQPRLKSVSTIDRAATDPDGNYEVGTAELEFVDEDNELAALLDAGETTEFWISREISIFYPSQELLDSEPTLSDLQPVFRGWITDVQQTTGRTILVKAADVVGSLMSASNVDRKVLRYQVKDLTSTPREDTKELFIKIGIGEFSDRGAEDENHLPASRGVWPVIEVCEVDTSNITGVPVSVFAAPPVITASSVTGATGQETLYYGATLITPYGESMMSNIVSCNGANRANRNVSNYNEISGTFAVGPDPLNPYKVRIWFGTTSTMVGWLDEANYTTPGVFGYFDGAAAWPTAARDELDDPKYMAPPLGNGAQTNENIFSIMAVCQGDRYDILDIYGSNLADGVEPARALIDASEHGVTTITANDPEWPYPNPWIEMNGLKITAFLQRGPKLQHHRDGVVTMAVNFCGPHDLMGRLIDQAFRQLVHLHNEFGVKNNGTGYTNLDYFTLETYANGDALIDTQSAEDCQDITKVWLGDEVGYQGNIWVIDPEETWRDVIQKSCQSFGHHFAASRFGQMTFFFINTVDDAFSGRHFREGIEIKRTEEPVLAHSQVINKGKLNYFYDVDAGDFRGKELPVSNPESIAQQVPGGVVGVADRRGERTHDFNLYFTNYAATATDVVNREFLRRARRPRYPSITTMPLGHDHDLGERCKLTDSHGLGPSGDQGSRVQILRHVANLDDEEVTLVFQDLRTIQTGVAIGDEATTSPEVGSESSVPPTAPGVG